MSGGRIVAIIVLGIIALYLTVTTFQFIQMYASMSEANRNDALIFFIVGWSIVVIGVFALLVTHRKPKVIPPKWHGPDDPLRRPVTNYDEWNYYEDLIRQMHHWAILHIHKFAGKYGTERETWETWIDGEKDRNWNSNEEADRRLQDKEKIEIEPSRKPQEPVVQSSAQRKGKY